MCPPQKHNQVFELLFFMLNLHFDTSAMYLHIEKKAAATGGVLKENWFLEISQNLQENTCARVSFLIKLQVSDCNLIVKETLPHVFSYKFCKISKNTFFYRTPVDECFLKNNFIFHKQCWSGLSSSREIWKCFYKTQKLSGSMFFSPFLSPFFLFLQVHCVKSAQTRSFFWSVFSCIQSKYRKIRTRKNSVFEHFSRSSSLFEMRTNHIAFD